MPPLFYNQRYYSAIEVCRAAGISKSTLLRWLKVLPFGKSVLRDRRGWRLFSEQDLLLIKDEANRTSTTSLEFAPMVSGKGVINNDQA